MADYNPILSAPQGANKNPKRVGRGSSSGLGTTAGKGNKGQQSRSGGKTYIGFEGGQMPLQRRVPKFGFKNINHVEYKAINLDVLQNLATAQNLDKITVADLVNAGFVSKKQLVKVLAKGTLTSKVDVEAHAFSKTAEEAITSLGGTATKL